MTTGLMMVGRILYPLQENCQCYKMPLMMGSSITSEISSIQGEQCYTPIVTHLCETIMAASTEACSGTKRKGQQEEKVWSKNKAGNKNLLCTLVHGAQGAQVIHETQEMQTAANQVSNEQENAMEGELQ